MCTNKLSRKVDLPGPLPCEANRCRHSDGSQYLGRATQVWGGQCIMMLEISHIFWLRKVTSRRCGNICSCRVCIPDLTRTPRALKIQFFTSHYEAGRC